MSAETLRRAAALMRERAERSVAAFSATGDGYVPNHPRVALAVADWLEQESLIADVTGDYFMHHPLAVARAYLGEA